jgi:hypothetical protein
MTNEYVKISLEQYERIKQENKALKAELISVKESKYIIPEPLGVAILSLIFLAGFLGVLYFEEILKVIL